MVTPRINRAVAVAALALVATSCGSAGSGNTRVVVPRGATLRAAAESLAAHGVIGSAVAFRAYAKVTGRSDELQAGTYQLRRGTPWSELLEMLARGRGLVRAVTIPEGFALSSIAPALAKALDVAEDSVMVAARDTALRRELDVPTPTVEGYLFPSTYTFVPGTSAREAVAEMAHQFERVWKPAWDARLDTLAMSRHDVMTLASIIEKEAVRPEERPVISAVYHNRLRKRMALQADPTVQYALGRHVARVLYKDLEVDSPYNTYRHVGLPPGPIASPGAPSIEAALYPANVPYLFFVAASDGHHEFRTTFAEHAAAIREIRRAREDSTPAPAPSARQSTAPRTRRR